MTIAEKSREIIISEICLRNTTLQDAVQFLRAEAWRLDIDLDYTIPGMPTDGPQFMRGVPIGYLVSNASTVRISLTLHDCDLNTALVAIAGQAGLALVFNESGCYLAPRRWLDEMRPEIDRQTISNPFCDSPAPVSAMLMVIDPAGDLDNPYPGETLEQFDQRRQTGLLIRAQEAMAAGDQAAFDAIPPDSQTLALQTPSLIDWTDETALRALQHQVQRAERWGRQRGYSDQPMTVVSQPLWKACCRAQGIHPDDASHYGATLRVLDVPSFVSFTWYPTPEQITGSANQEEGGAASM